MPTKAKYSLAIAMLDPTPATWNLVDTILRLTAIEQPVIAVDMAQEQLFQQDSRPQGHRHRCDASRDHPCVNPSQKHRQDDKRRNSPRGKNDQKLSSRRSQGHDIKGQRNWRSGQEYTLPASKLDRSQTRKWSGEQKSPKRVNGKCRESIPATKETASTADAVGNDEEERYKGDHIVPSCEVSPTPSAFIQSNAALQQKDGQAPTITSTVVTTLMPTLVHQPPPARTPKLPLAATTALGTGPSAKPPEDLDQQCMAEEEDCHGKTQHIAPMAPLAIETTKGMMYNATAQMADTLQNPDKAMTGGEADTPPAGPITLCLANKMATLATTVADNVSATCTPTVTRVHAVPPADSTSPTLPAVIETNLGVIQQATTRTATTLNPKEKGKTLNPEFPKHRDEKGSHDPKTHCCNMPKGAKQQETKGDDTTMLINAVVPTKPVVRTKSSVPSATVVVHPAATIVPSLKGIVPANTNVMKPVHSAADMWATSKKIHGIAMPTHTHPLFWSTRHQSTMVLGGGTPTGGGCIDNTMQIAKLIARAPDTVKGSMRVLGAKATLPQNPKLKMHDMQMGTLLHKANPRDDNPQGITQAGTRLQEASILGTRATLSKTVPDETVGTKPNALEYPMNSRKHQEVDEWPSKETMMPYKNLVFAPTVPKAVVASSGQAGPKAPSWSTVDYESSPAVVINDTYGSPTLPIRQLEGAVDVTKGADIIVPWTIPPGSIETEDSVPQKPCKITCVHAEEVTCGTPYILPETMAEVAAKICVHFLWSGVHGIMMVDMWQKKLQAVSTETKRMGWSSCAYNAQLNSQSTWRMGSCAHQANIPPWSHDTMPVVK